MTAHKNVLIDNVAIRRRIDGHHRIDLNKAERLRAIRILHRQGMNDREIADELGYQHDWVGKWRRKLQLPKNADAGRRHLVDA